MSDFYIVSVNHAHAEDRFILFFRPENGGYTFRTSTAGKYDDTTVRDALSYYNSGSSTIAVPAEVVDRMTILTTPADCLDGPNGPAVLNTRSNWNKLIASAASIPEHPPKPGIFKRKPAPVPSYA